MRCLDVERAAGAGAAQRGGTERTGESHGLGGGGASSKQRDEHSHRSARGVRRGRSADSRADVQPCGGTGVSVQEAGDVLAAAAALFAA